MKQNFKNRIAFLYLLATALVMAIVFGFIFFIVRSTVYQNLDRDLAYEAEKHTTEVAYLGDSIHFFNKKEWEEREHREVQVNPVFIQIMNNGGQLMDKSPNLKDQQLSFHANQSMGDHFNSTLNNRAIRQVQIPLQNQGNTQGFVLAAMSLESSQMVVQKLRTVLLLLYPLIIVGLFFISRYLAGLNISPIQNIILTTNRITKNNLHERIPLPKNRDELFELSTSINELMERLEKALLRERQFTSDASHELRTPLASLRGTLEVLIRKGRSQGEYEEKVRFSLSEIDRMTVTLDQLLTLARFDPNRHSPSSDTQAPLQIIDEILDKYRPQIWEKNLQLVLSGEVEPNVEIPTHYSNLILDNIIQNAVKYARENSTLEIHTELDEGNLVCTVRDEGPGIRQEDLAQLFQPFFRSDPMSHRQVEGNGLGLSIAQKAAEVIQANIKIESREGQGTTVHIHFKPILRKTLVYS